MSEKFERWKEDLEDRASEVIEPSEGEISAAVHNVAEQMGDAESLKMGEQSIEDIIKQYEAEGWHYRGPVSGVPVFEAIAKEGKEIRIVGTGTERVLFEREKGADTD